MAAIICIIMGLAVSPKTALSALALLLIPPPILTFLALIIRRIYMLEPVSCGTGRVLYLLVWSPLCLLAFTGLWWALVGLKVRLYGPIKFIEFQRHQINFLIVSGVCLMLPLLSFYTLIFVLRYQAQ